MDFGEDLASLLEDVHVFWSESLELSASLIIENGRCFDGGLVFYVFGEKWNFRFF